MSYNLPELERLAYLDQRKEDFTKKELNYFLRVRLIYDWHRAGMISEEEGKKLKKEAKGYYCE